jgi:hypothetical protein
LQCLRKILINGIEKGIDNGIEAVCDRFRRHIYS